MNDRPKTFREMTVAEIKAYRGKKIWMRIRIRMNAQNKLARGVAYQNHDLEETSEEAMKETIDGFREMGTIEVLQAGVADWPYVQNNVIMEKRHERNNFLR